MSGGGAQSALLGATGDSDLYTPYLDAIGAVSGVSDAVAGSMCWCPITNPDYASEAYEWNLGVTRTGFSEDIQELSDAMAERFALYLNELNLKDENGNSLTLTVSEDGIYQAGSYYDYLKGVIETSLNHFLEDTAFPYTVAEGGRGGFGGPNGIGGPDGIGEPDSFGGPEDFGALNAETTWVLYDEAANAATITSIADFVSAFKPASKNLGAFDALDASQGENVLFGYGDGVGAHFDATMAELLADSEYAAEFTEDLSRTDALGNSVEYRVDMYNPLYYLNDFYEGCGSSNVASYWRIRSGINQSDTALTTETNLALALENYGVDVDFETVWGKAMWKRNALETAPRTLSNGSDNAAGNAASLFRKKKYPQQIKKRRSS